jgi:hypothetical protein
MCWNKPPVPPCFSQTVKVLESLRPGRMSSFPFPWPCVLVVITAFRGYFRAGERAFCCGLLAGLFTDRLVTYRLASQGN